MTAHLAHAATRRLRICRRLRGVRASRTVQGGRKDSLKRPESGQGRPDRTSVQTDLVVQSEHSHRVSEKESGWDPQFSMLIAQAGRVAQSLLWLREYSPIVQFEIQE